MARDTVAAVRTDLEEAQRVIGSLATPQEMSDALQATFEPLNERLNTLEARVQRIADHLNSAPAKQQVTTPPAQPAPASVNAPANTEGGVKCGKCTKAANGEARFHSNPADVKACYALTA